MYRRSSLHVHKHILISTFTYNKYVQHYQKNQAISHIPIFPLDNLTLSLLENLCYFARQEFWRVVEVVAVDDLIIAVGKNVETIKTVRKRI